MPAAKETIAERISEAEKQIAEAKKIEGLLARFPDLQHGVDRWKREYWSSPSANAQVTDVWIKHGCGCCNDSPLLACPFLEVEGTKIFSEPFQICIGEKNAWGYGECPDPEWEKRLKDCNISPVVVEHVRRYLEANPPNPPGDDDD